MKIVACTVMIVAMASAAAAPRPLADGAVTVCDEMGTELAFGSARSRVTEMFARIGVTLAWRGAGRCPSGALRIRLSSRGSGGYPPDVLGYAYPYEGSQIVVFWDRIEAAVSGSDAAPVLAHVMAHEITHVLEGCDHHSLSGLMKARWDKRDFREMIWKPLPFDEEDIELIRQGVAQREHSGAVGDRR